MKDKYSAIWLSHSSITDYLKCPRSYYLKNIYRDPKNNHKIAIMQPALALGQVVHEVLESLSKLPVEERFREPLRTKFDTAWLRVSGKQGGFTTGEEEEKYKQRGIEMLERVTKNPGPLLRKAIKIRQELPYFWLSEEQNLILCGKLDWLEYIEETDSVRIIDFKTGKFDEDADSLQLPIYELLAKNCQTKDIAGAQYWYLNRDDTPVDMNLPTEEDATKRVMEVARTVALARKLERFLCPHKEGCSACRPYEMIVEGKAEFIGVGGYNQDTYILH